MAEIDFMSALHKCTARDYLARVNDTEFPKAKAAELAKRYDYDYWDGDRRICYGGYTYIEGRWEKVVRALINTYDLPKSQRYLISAAAKVICYTISLRLCPMLKFMALTYQNMLLQTASPRSAKDYVSAVQQIFRGQTILSIL